MKNLWDMKLTYIESIGISIKEYLVNFDYLASKAKKYNLELVETKNFSSLLTDKKYGSMSNMNEQLKEYSFLNTTFVFQKI